MDPFITAWAQAIASFEGSNSPNSLPARNNNPGDLKYAGQPGAIGADARGFAIFPDAESGWQALYRQLQKYVNDFPGYSILQITARYLGQSVPTNNAEGNAFTYANFVATALGVTPDTTLADLAAGVTQATSDVTAADAPTDPTIDPTAPDGGASGSGGALAMLLVGGVLLWAVARAVSG